ncbi:MAG: hypothetical protein N4A37_03675 [Prolixibacteraceae bacterium]|jgi:hypothetical protein|nr:hypothetical protein [Prolixibacteraceae bacterium]
MVPPWFLHGLSIDLGVFDGGTMDKPWRNHEGSTYESTIFRVFFLLETLSYKEDVYYSLRRT